MSKIAHPNGYDVRLRKSGLIGRLWPNGEVSFHYPKREETKEQRASSPSLKQRFCRSLVASQGVGAAVKTAVLMGLLNVPNFDNAENQIQRKGLKGITRKGRRTVRNGCYLLEKESGHKFLTFATVTCPSLTDEQMGTIHEKWFKIVEHYRREIRRELRRAGLPGEMVGVSEIQPKRFKKEGKPCLHCHFVWKGRKRGHNWAINPKKHDEIWLRAIDAVIPGAVDCVKSAAQLKNVKSSAEGYLSKYLSKGAGDLKEVVRLGFASWVPKQWWSCSRSLSQRIRRSQYVFEKGTDWLIRLGEDRNTDMYLYFVPIKVEGKRGDEICVGYTGRLTESGKALFFRVAGVNSPGDV